MGSTAAVAKLMGLDGNELRAALALGASQAGGLQQNFGTMIKPFHAGRAAENGVLAASLAKKGWTGDQNIMETPLGFLHIFCEGDKYTGQKCVSMLGNPYDIDHPGIILKKFPSCAFSHPVIDASLIIAQDPQYDPQKIEKVEGHIHALANQILIHKNPQTGLEAKFSMEACSAFALVDGEVKSSSFSDDKVRSNEIKEMMTRIHREIVPSPENGPTEFGPATVRVFLKDGKVMEARVDKAKGNPGNPMSENEVREKYMDCCNGILEDQAIEESLSLLEGLDTLGKISQLMKCYKLS
jgi:2-methylcitrate dehydratase PrpD